MLEMRPSCECCDRDISPSDGIAYICSFECTWCADCVACFADDRCPNCGGALTLRPTHALAKLLGSPRVDGARLQSEVPGEKPHPLKRQSTDRLEELAAR